MRTTFINCNQSERKAFRQRGRKHVQSRAEDFNHFMEYGAERDELEHHSAWETFSTRKKNQILKKFDETGNFYDYGLSLDYQEKEGRKRGYFRFQLSWGGPSEEIRFYFDGDGSRGQADKIEFVFMDWGTGIGFDVTGEDWAQWLWDWFQSCGTVQYEYNKAMELAD